MDDIQVLLDKINAVSQVKYSVAISNGGYIVSQHGIGGSYTNGKVLTFDLLMRSLELLLFVKTIVRN